MMTTQMLAQEIARRENLEIVAYNKFNNETHEFERIPANEYRHEHIYEYTVEAQGGEIRRFQGITGTYAFVADNDRGVVAISVHVTDANYVRNHYRAFLATADGKKINYKYKR
jgi:hypothetical protein